jgi:hypothetical protein
MIKEIINAEKTIRYELKFTHPDYGSNYVTAIVVFDDDDDDETDFYLDNLRTYLKLWERYNWSGFYHTMTVERTDVWIDDTVTHRTHFEGSKYDLIAMIDRLEKFEMSNVEE